MVSKGRETLERCIKLIENTERWRAKVVYGDTDSVFVLLPGRTKAEAFNIGEEMAKVVTEDNPKPVKLKFEKVYLPCILQTKKRYVGYMYETRDQKDAVYDAKGIETVRRDGCPAVVKVSNSFLLSFLHFLIRLLFFQDSGKVAENLVRDEGCFQSEALRPATVPKDHPGKGLDPRSDLCQGVPGNARLPANCCRPSS